jgi:hypothetical protein
MLFSNNVKLIILVVLVVLLIVMLNNNDKNTKKKSVVRNKQVQQAAPQVQQQPKLVVENFDDSTTNTAASQLAPAPTPTSTSLTTTQQNMAALAEENDANQITFNCSDYLPQETNQDWFETDFDNAQLQCDSTSLVTTDRYIVGVNTVGQSLKNASYDLRAQPPCPKFKVSPWNNSTIEPDFNIKPLWDTTPNQ